LVIDVPQEFIHRNALIGGSRVKLHLIGRRMVVEVPARPRHAAAELIAEMLDGLPRVEGWDVMPAVGGEEDSGAMRYARNGLSRFAASQKNIDRLAIRLFVCATVFGALVAVATIAAMFAR
jgi:antitoxin ChpS